MISNQIKKFLNLLRKNLPAFFDPPPTVLPLAHCQLHKGLKNPAVGSRGIDGGVEDDAPLILASELRSTLNSGRTGWRGRRRCRRRRGFGEGRGR